MVLEKRAVRIAGCSGSATDRRDALATLASNHPRDPLDVIIGDWMSEANMTARGISKTDNPDVAAYEPTFLEALEPALSSLAEHKIKLAVNAGASDTQKLHEVVSDMVASRKLDLKVAWISGDEVLPAVRKALSSGSSALENVYTGEMLSDWKFEPAYAQAYLGGMGIAAALEAGADIVICGRVSDASPVIGSAAWWHSWKRDDIDQLANALVAGHLIECSSYVCGGNFSGFKSIRSANLVDIGYPIAEIEKDGRVVITKSRDSGGLLSVDTCTSQLLYEIQGPWYFNSDVTAILDGISFEQLETNRVALKGVKGSAPPPTTKVGITAKGGYQAEMHWFIVGLDIREKAAMMEAQIRKLLTHQHRFSMLAFTLNGSSPDNPTNQNSATVDFRVFAQAAEAEDLAPSKFARPCLDPIMSGYPGATPHLDLRTAFPKPFYEYYVTLIPQSEVEHTVHIPWRKSSQSIQIPPPSQTQSYPPQQPSQPETSAGAPPAVKAVGGLTDAAGGWAELPAAQGRSILREVFGAWGRTVRGPLGWIVHARSGDKGSDCNVGFWVRHEAEYDWLRHLLSVKKMIQLLGEEYDYAGSAARAGKGKKIDRFEIPGCRAVHFLLHGHLDRGVSATSTYDFLGKNVAEYLRARWVDLPVKFLNKSKI